MQAMPAAGPGLCVWGAERSKGGGQGERLGGYCGGSEKTRGFLDKGSGGEREKLEDLVRAVSR